MAGATGTSLPLSSGAISRKAHHPAGSRVSQTRETCVVTEVRCLVNPQVRAKIGERKYRWNCGEYHMLYLTAVNEGEATGP